LLVTVLASHENGLLGEQRETVGDALRDKRRDSGAPQASHWAMLYAGVRPASTGAIGANPSIMSTVSSGVSAELSMSCSSG